MYFDQLGSIFQNKDDYELDFYCVITNNCNDFLLLYGGTAFDELSISDNVMGVKSGPRN